MNKKVLIVEDQFVEANDLQLMLQKAKYEVCGIARSVPVARTMIMQDQPDIVLLDIFLKGNETGIDLANELNEANIAFIYLSANSNEEVLSKAKTTDPYGFIVKPFREKDLLVTLEIAQYRHEHSITAMLRKSALLKQQLSSVMKSSSGRLDHLLAVTRTLQAYISFDFLAARFDHAHDRSNDTIGFLRIGYEEYQAMGMSELMNITRISSKELAALSAVTRDENSITVLVNEAFEEISLRPTLHKVFAGTFDLQSCLSIKLNLSNRQKIYLCCYSKHPDTYRASHGMLLTQVEQELAGCLEKAFNHTQVISPVLLKQSANSESKVSLDGRGEFANVIGNSHVLLKVFDLVAQVAPADTSVLILGESGTGKERIADCLHRLSGRKNKPFIKINCAALPATLIESELFGHEKGSFTGATDKRIGKFEKADTGTIFLDEIGEMPLDLQVKLLRVLQEKYIERIGARDATKVDVRIIAATNRNLEKEVAAGRFRLDLYYRLNVFPIVLPPLRDRLDDIMPLTDHFIRHYNQKTGKQVIRVSENAIKAMMSYDWPGNVRELENVIERSVLMAKDGVIEEVGLPVVRPWRQPAGYEESRTKTIHENERDYIIAVLKKCNGKIWGAGGAAEALNIPPSTLKSKMKKLGIRKTGFF